MKTPARLALVLLAGLSLSGCVTTTTSRTKPAPQVAQREEQPLSASVYFYLRDLEDKGDRALGANTR